MDLCVSKKTGVPARYEQVTPDEMIRAAEDVEMGIEVTHMFRYMSDPGYDGGMNLLTASDIVKVSTVLGELLTGCSR